MAARQTVVALILALGGALSAVPIAAQERIELLTRIGDQWSMVEVDASVSGFGAVRRVDPLPPASVRSIYSLREPAVMAGGRYILWQGGESYESGNLVVFDRRSRSTTVIGGFRYSLDVNAIDPVQPRFFAKFDANIWVLDARTLQWRPLLHTWEQRLFTSGLSDLAYAPGADLLFAINTNGSKFARILAIPVDHAGPVQEFQVDADVSYLDVDASGRRLWLRGWVTAFSKAAVMLLDTASRQVVRTAEMDFEHPITVDEPRGLLLGSRTDPHTFSGLNERRRLAVLDATTLSTLALLPLDLGRLGDNLERNFSLLPGRWMTGAYVVRTEVRRRPQTCNAILIDALDPAGGLRQTADILAQVGPGRTGCAVEPVLVRSPFAPAALGAEVTGRRVTLSWQNPGDVAEFEIQAGLTPGGTALTQRVGLETTALTYDGVPPGIYFVRVRAFNEIGGSPASNEVRVVVQ